uniref:Reverse transcriptase zinc-binding domain-containing protein n=1 Tax=Quercus lobata TaxID=97700 RepID=A0A7N2LE19_QUELO
MEARVCDLVFGNLSFPEDVKHTLWDCEAVKIVWCKDFSWVNRFEAANGTFLYLMEWLITKLGIADLFATTAWLIWTHRNKSQLLEKTTPLGSIGEATKSWLLQFRSSREEHCCGKLPCRRKWLPLEPGEFKANFDGAMFNESDEARVGVVIGTPWVRLFQQWLKKSENLIVWSAWRCLQLDGQ